MEQTWKVTRFFKLERFKKNSLSLVLARAFHALAKIGEELHFEPTESGLVIKTVNSSKSAFSSFHFRSEFFLTYSWRGQSTAESSDQEDTVAKCKLPMKVLGPPVV